MPNSFTIRCQDENRIALSSDMEIEAWKAIQELAELLKHDLYPSVTKALFSWKGEPEHLASAKETYAWRDLIETIKLNDLDALTAGAEEDNVAVSRLMKSKPIMLRMAGEITNALIHSYDNRHRITLDQNDSVRPS